MVFQWFPMVANHWSDNGMVTIHRSGLNIYMYKVGAVKPPSLMVFMWLYVCTQMLIITTMQYSISLVLCICVRLQSYRFPIPSCTGQRPIHKNIHLHPKIWYAHLARLEHNHKMIHMNRIREVLSLILREVKKQIFCSILPAWP